MEATSQTVQATGPNELSRADQPTRRARRRNPRRASTKVTRYRRPRFHPKFRLTRHRPRPRQVSAPQGNPWQQAFQALSASLNTSNPFPGPGFTLGLPADANTPGSYTTQLGLSSPAGAADFAAPTLQPRLTRNRKWPNWCNRRRPRQAISI